ncbi:nck-associated protein 5-like [Brachyhypopomus gauderio]|uniref:nck-associated protein 5-like n=1 Tax=Brachyhypopomus gauderio TaxID=698409 RepID=UPI004041894B
MSEPRDCDEAFETEEGDGELFLEEEEEEDETESSKELLERIRELEAENTALAQASEQQREVYERCLDEVANHVVQALLNQKDLREECINLKMRVFDLERHNRTLTELFTQKLHSSPNTSHQLPAVPCVECSCEPGLPDMAVLTGLFSEWRVENNDESTQTGTGNPNQDSGSSTGPMSPFLKKKAHILEVLRKLEETDPLRFHPSTCYYHHGQALLPGEMTTIGAASPRQPHCRHSSSDSDIHEYANEEGDNPAALRYGSCPSCRVLSQRNSLDSLLKCNQHLSITSHSGREDDTSSRMCPEQYGASGQSTDAQAKLLCVVKTNIPNAHCTVSQSRVNVTHLSQPVAKAIGPHLSPVVASCPEPNTKLGEKTKHDRRESDSEEISSTKSKSVNEDKEDSGRSLTAGQAGDRLENLVQVCSGVFSSNQMSVPRKVVESYSQVSISETTASALTQQQAAAKSKLAQGSTSSPSLCSESKPSPVSSSSTLLKLLKMPLMAENSTTANALHLSPQLTHNSKIPCRNHYEVYHSPTVSRKATTTEREKPSTASKTVSRPATHSAPNSPPQPEDLCSSLSLKESGFNSHSTPKVSKSANESSSQPLKGGTVAHYENLVDPSHSRNDLPQITSEETDSKEKQKISSRDERVLSHLSLTSSESSGTTDESASDSSDQDTDPESPVWQRPQNHFSLPTSSSAANKAQRSSYSSMKEKYHERKPPDPLSARQHGTSVPTQAVAKRSDKQPSLPKRTVSSKPQTDSSYHPFKERLAALGKLKGTEDLQQTTAKQETQSGPGKSPASIGCRVSAKTAERQSGPITVEQRRLKGTEPLDAKSYPKTSFGNYGKGPGSVNINISTEKHYIAKPDSQKIKIGMSSATPCETPVVMWSYGRNPNPLAHHSRTVPSPQSSPVRVQSKSPSKASTASSYPRGMKLIQDERSHLQRQPSRTDDKPKLTAGKRKTFSHVGNIPPPLSPRPGSSNSGAFKEKRLSSTAPAIQSAIEQKVMRGIEENMLKLQGQDGGPAAETKQRTSNGIASWFGLKKSKLPALNRKSEMSKLKHGMSSSSSSPGAKDASGAKGAPKKVVESLNISKLMEKAEDLRKALEEERVYVNGVGIALERPGRGHSCEVVMDQAQGQLSLMYRGVTADNFMQQLLNRVDERGAVHLGVMHRRLSFDSKRSRPVYSHQRNSISHTRSREDIDKLQGSDMVSRDEITSDESLAESISSQHFTGSGSSIRTLDSGIGTFPLPDCGSSSAGKRLPQPQEDQSSFTSQGKHGALMKTPRQARTLEREPSSLDEVKPSVLLTSPLEAQGATKHLSDTIHEDMDAYGVQLQAAPTQNWTFPNPRGSAGPTNMYLQDMESAHPESPSRPSKRLQQSSHEADPRSHPFLPQTGATRRGKARTHAGPEVPKAGGLELVKECPDDAVSPSRPQALETPESLSDSLYDSLSSCGSQG